MNRDVHDMRQDYHADDFTRETALEDPLQQFDTWFQAVVAHKDITEPNAMVLATADIQGQPSARMVLLKEYATEGFIFYTNYLSRKANDLAANPRASLLFYWEPLARQVRIEGTIAKVAPEVSDEYFNKRPYGSRIGAVASPQSSVIQSRETLEQKVAELQLQYPEEHGVPRPDNWGGYVLVPSYYEFWQGRSSRLHDRIAYLPCGNNDWERRRLAP